MLKGVRIFIISIPCMKMKQVEITYWLTWHLGSTTKKIFKWNWQKKVSSLGRLEGQVLITIERVLKHFKSQSHFEIVDEISSGLKKITYQESRNVTTKRSRLLLGRPRKGRSTRIMVTLDLESVAYTRHGYSTYQLCT